MKKIFLIAVVLLMMINFIINYQHEVTKEKHTPMADFKTKVEMAPMKEYNDPDFGYVIKYLYIRLISKHLSEFIR